MADNDQEIEKIAVMMTESFERFMEGIMKSRYDCVLTSGIILDDIIEEVMKDMPSRQESRDLNNVYIF